MLYFNLFYYFCIVNIPITNTQCLYPLSAANGIYHTRTNGR